MLRTSQYVMKPSSRLAFTLLTATIAALAVQWVSGDSRQQSQPTPTTQPPGLADKEDQSSHSTAPKPPGRFTTLKPIGDWSVDPADTSRLQDIFAQAANAAASITPGPDAPA